MSINLDDALTDNLGSQGGITTDTVLAGDLTGNMPAPLISSLQGLALPTSGFADGLGLRISGGAFVLVSTLTEDTLFGGDVSGSQAAGLAVRAIDGTGVEISSPQSGEILQYNGSTFVNAPNAAGDSYTDVKTADFTAGSKNRVLCDSTSAAFTVTLPPTPSAGDYVFVIDAAESFGTNAVTVIGSNSDTINGSTTGLVANVDNAYVQFIYNGAEWKYFVISVRG